MPSGRTLRALDPLLQDLVDDSERQRLLGREEIVSVCLARDFLDRFPGVLRHQAVEALAQRKNVASMDFYVGRLALKTAQWLMDHYRRVRQYKALALSPGREEKRSHRGRHAHAKRRDIRLAELHGAVNRHPRRHRAAWRIDIAIDVLVR